MRVEQASGDGNLLSDQVSESPERMKERWPGR
jgi:hypothetical protein